MHTGKMQTVNGPGGNTRQAKKSVWAALGAQRANPVLNLLLCVLVPAATVVLTEWVARGSLADNTQGNGFFQSLGHHFHSFLIAFILLLGLYVCIAFLTGLHAVATGLTALAGYLPAIVTHYKLTMRGEPFLPWDIIQIGDLMAVKSSVSLSVPHTIIVAEVVIAAMTALAAYVRIPRLESGKTDCLSRLIISGSGLFVVLFMLFAIFLSPRGTAAMGIKEDMWMQDRYYRTNGVITGFLTNLQLLNISQPQGYSAQAVEDIAAETAAQAGDTPPLYSGGNAAGAAAITQTPDIIFLMAESFWDVTALPGITYDQPLLENLAALASEGAYGRAFSPSFGGGTCDVEFEALTGFSKEHLPAGSKPYQQYVTEDTFSLPWALKQQGYSTTAIHGYGRRFWNRDMAYPRLGIDTFIASDDFVNPEKRRGFISDSAMADRIIEEIEARRDDGPVFIHAVTMQNHTTYNRNKYPEDELVRVTSYPDALPDSTIGQLEDCATGIREMDAALGKLADYLRGTGRPTILVFWGDHLNPMSDGYALFEKTGYIAAGDTSAPVLHEVPLLIWSNYAAGQVELGTLATYNIAPVMMDLYGLEKPVLFEFLAQSLAVTRGRTLGYTIEPGGGYATEMNDAQQAVFDEHAILQYDYLFGGRMLWGPLESEPVENG